MPRPPLVPRIQTDPVYRAVIRLVGYLGIDYPISREDTDSLFGEFGKEKVQAASGLAFPGGRRLESPPYPSRGILPQLGTRGR